MDFKTATDRLTGRVTAEEIADACGVARNTIARARLDPASEAYRPAPVDWRRILVKLAKQRIKQLEALIRTLEAEGDDRRTR